MLQKENISKYFTQKNKKLSSQILNYFFGIQTLKLKYGKESWNFHFEFGTLKKWTKKMSKNGEPNLERPKKSRFF